jgi:ribosomal protein L11 methyltransferase
LASRERVYCNVNRPPYYNTLMYWQALSFVAPETVVEAVADALMDTGALSVDVADADAGSEAERAIFREPNEASPERWVSNRVTALFAAEHKPEALSALALALGNALDFTPHSTTLSRVDDADWVRLTQSQFAPIEIDPALWIVPTWRDAPKADALNLVLDPGLAFGTGSHPTTRLCLRWLLGLSRAGAFRQGERVLDYGCGSGILAIAAERLGASAVVGTDIDAQALLVAKENATRNDAHHAVWLLPNAVPVGPYPIVVANILANPLCVLAPMLCEYVAPGGKIALAGILAEQVDKVTAAYAPWISLSVANADDGWQLLTGTRKA